MGRLQDQINLKYYKNNRIQSVLFEVTHRCLSRCLHCLLVKNTEDELSYDEVSDLMVQLVREGTIELGISGGEPFLRDDLPQILTTARKHHFIVYLLTTGALIEKAEVNLLQKLKIKKLEISLLGAGPTTHDGIMQFPGAFNRTVSAVKLLRAAGIAMKLKSVLMQPNWKELPAMAKLAEDLGALFSASVTITPRVDGNPAPKRLALTESQIAQLDPDLVDEGLIPGEEQRHGAMLKCMAGKTSAGISPQGDIFPCIIFRHKIGNIRTNSLQEIWHDNPSSFLSEWRELKPEDINECFSCDLKSYCTRCPGVAYLETGDVRLPSPTSCKLATDTHRLTRTKSLGNEILIHHRGRRESRE